MCLALFWILFAPARTITRVYGLLLLSSPLDIVLDHSLPLPTILSVCHCQNLACIMTMSLNKALQMDSHTSSVPSVTAIS